MIPAFYRLPSPIGSDMLTAKVMSAGGNQPWVLHSDNTAQPGKLHAKCKDDKFGVSALLHVAPWNCSCEAAWGTPLLLAPLAAVAAGWITACRWFHHLGDKRVGLYITQDSRHFASECRRVIY